MLDDVYHVPSHISGGADRSCAACGDRTTAVHRASMNPVCFRCARSLQPDDPRFRPVFRFIPRPPAEEAS